MLYIVFMQYADYMSRYTRGVTSEVNTDIYIQSHIQTIMPRYVTLINIYLGA